MVGQLCGFPTRRAGFTASPNTTDRPPSACARWVCSAYGSTWSGANPCSNSGRQSIDHGIRQYVSTSASGRSINRSMDIWPPVAWVERCEAGGDGIGGAERSGLLGGLSVWAGRLHLSRRRRESWPRRRCGFLRVKDLVHRFCDVDCALKAAH